MSQLSFTDGMQVSPASRLTGNLAFRMRPQTLDQVVGQERLIGAGKPLRRWVETDRMPSLLFWGPPGCGKTTLATVISLQTHSAFDSLSAVLAGVKDIKEVIHKAETLLRLTGRKTILFVDEIHRFNRGQQDALLPHVENGTVTLIGATTENPSFEINSALLSRLRVMRLERLTDNDLVETLRNAISDSVRGLGGFLQVSDEALQWLASTAEGDARRALTALESVSLFSEGGLLNLEQVQAALECSLVRQPLPYDKMGEEHHNVVSAFIKSLRDSDPHAGLYYLARMLESGEDPLFIIRRMVVLASEDIGNADPRALTLALAAKDAVDFVGMPEARIHLAQVVTYLAMAPKSNASYVGITQAIAEVQKTGALPTPLHLRNGVTPLMREYGYGKNYQYAHSHPEGMVRQTHLPDALVGQRFYEPKLTGLEKQFKEKLDLFNINFE